LNSTIDHAHNTIKGGGEIQPIQRSNDNIQ
jgi:hypothetical protein